MNLLHFIIFIVVSYYCAYILDFVFYLLLQIIAEEPLWEH